MLRTNAICLLGLLGRATTLGILVLPLLIGKEALAAADLSLNESFLSAHQKGGDELRVLRRPDGLVNRVGGLFSTSSSVTGDVSHTALQRAALQFVTSHKKGFGLPSSFEAATAITFTGAKDTPSGITLVEGFQNWHGIPVRGGGLVFGFLGNGDLIMLNGTLFPNQTYALDTDIGFGVGDAVDIVSKRANVSARPDETSDRRGPLWRLHEPGTDNAVNLWREADPAQGQIVWMANDSRVQWVIDPRKRNVAEEHSLVDPVEVPVEVSRKVKHAKINQDARQWHSDPNNIPGRDYTDERVYRQEVSWAANWCQYSLKRTSANGGWADVSSWNNALYHPFGFCSAEGFNAIVCGNNFSCEDSDDYRFRQQHYYVKLSQALNTFTDLVYDAIGPRMTASVRLTLDAPAGNVYTGDGSPCNVQGLISACFVPPQDIFVVSPNLGTSVLWHEVGHYFQNLYGNFRGGCTLGENEASLVKESAASAVANLIYRHQLASVASYEASLGQPHIDVPADFSDITICQARAVPAFVQAIWEIAWNADCTKPSSKYTVRLREKPFVMRWQRPFTQKDYVKVPIPTCANFNDPKSDIGWLNNDHANRSLLRSIAWATAASTNTTTLNAFVENILTYLYFYEGPAIGAAADSVFRHHGFRQ